MRWFVEIASLGSKSGNDTTLCVEAPQWQPALQKARALRGDNGALSNFSIELLDDGYRAIDPMSRLRYIVRRAPDDAALTSGASAPPAAAKPAAEAAKPAAAQPQVKPETAPETVAASAVVIPAAEAPKPRTLAGAASERTASDPLPSFVMVGSREENPTDASPLTYREYVYAVAEGTPEDDVRRLISERFAHVKATLDPSRAGKLVNLAVFDHVFHGRPLRRPVITLTWKDWKGDAPELRVPPRDAPGDASTPFSTRPPVASAPPPAAPAAAAPPPAAPAAAPTPISVPALAAPVPAKPVASAPVVASPVVASPPSGGSPAAGSTLSSAQPVVPPKHEPAPAVPVVEAKAAPVEAEPVQAAPAKPVASTPAPVEAPKPAPKPAAEVKAPVVKPTPVPETRPVPTVASASFTAGSALGASKPKKRLTGDDLLAELFEAFGDLHFVRDSLEGAEFVLNLTLEKLPSEVGIVSLFDMNTREFVIVRQVGGPRKALCARQPERAELAFRAMRRRHAIVISDARGAEDAMDDRWRAIGVELKSLACVPIELSGRFLGLIELANPTDGHVFNEGDGNALTYIGQQFSEFVAARGVIVDPAQIRGEDDKALPPPSRSGPKSIGPKSGPKSVAPAKKGR